MAPKRRKRKGKGILGDTFLNCPAIVEQLSKEDPVLLERMGGKTLKAVEAFNSTKKENEGQPARYYNILVFLYFYFILLDFIYSDIDLLLRKMLLFDIKMYIYN